MCTTRSSQRSQFGSFTDFRSVLLPFTTGTNVLLYSIIFLFIHASVWKQEVWRGVNHTLTCEIAERVGCHKQHCGRWSEPILNLLTASLTRRSHIVTLPCSEKRKAEETNTFFFLFSAYMSLTRVSVEACWSLLYPVSFCVGRNWWMKKLHSETPGWSGSC